MAAERPLRADAQRNRQRILDAAREAFAADGPAVSLDEIARRAGVGPGTVHRHFPAKEALVDAVLADNLGDLTAQARDALRSDDGGSAFYSFLEGLIRSGVGKQDLAEALTAPSQLAEAKAAELRDAFADLLDRAQLAGVVRTDVSAADVQSIVVGAIAAERNRAEHPGRIAAILLTGLRPLH